MHREPGLSGSAPECLSSEEAAAAAPKLSPAQRAAVEHTGSPLIVLAGPGSGKTRVLTERIAHMIRERGVRPESVVAVTYTTRAAAQLRDRLAGLIGPAGQRVHAHTFHGLGLRLIRRFSGEIGLRAARTGERALFDAAGGPDIMDSAQRKRLLRDLVARHELFAHRAAHERDAVIADISRHQDLLADHALSADDVRAFVARARANLELGQDGAGAPLDAAGAEAQRFRLIDLLEHARAAELFDRACRERGWLSFAQLIGLAIQVLRTSPRARAMVRDEFRHVLVDEFQDANTAQIELLAALAPPESTPDLTVVGDDDQAIYAFRGADERAFARFADRWRGSRTVVLDENYRCSPCVVEVSAAIIAQAGGRFRADKSLRPASPAPRGSPVELVMLDQDGQEGEAIAAMILLDRAEPDAAARPPRAWSSYAVIARNHLDLSRTRAALDLEGVPSVVQRAGSWTDDPGVQRVLWMIQAIADPRQSYALIALLLRAPLSTPIERVRAISRAFSATRPRDGGVETDEHPTLITWMRQHAADEPGVARLLEWYDDLSGADATGTAEQTVDRIVRTIDAVHADLPEGRARAARVTALAAMLGFVRARQPRLEAPGDLRALVRYMDDLDPAELAEPELAERVDTPSGEAEDRFSGRDAVRLLTAHGAKGLEFDTVFVPRVAPRGYPSVKSDDSEDLPEGLVDRLGDKRSPDERRADEERRIFYVACTRAQRRLVLLAKQNKTRSRSVHFLEEIRYGGACDKAIVVRPAGDIFAECGRLGLGSRDAIWRRPTDDPAGRPAERDRTAVLADARRDARSAAAAALDELEGAVHIDPASRAGAVERASAALASAAARLADVVAVSRDPGASVDPDLARLLADADAADADARGSRGAWRRLVSEYTPPGPLHTSYSQLELYLFCPRCYLVRHRLGLPEQRGDPQIVGLVVHAALQEFAKRRRNAEADGLFGAAELGVSELLSMGESLFRAAWPSDEAVDAAQLQQVRALLTAAFELERQGDPNVLEIEHTINIPFGPHSVQIRVDRIDEITAPGGGVLRRIVDYKTGKATGAKLEPAADDLQLCLYALGARHLAEDANLEGVAEYWVLQAPARGVLPFSRMKLDKVRQKVQAAIDGILAGRFERSRSSGAFGRSHCCDVLGPLGAAQDD